MKKIAVHTTELEDPRVDGTRVYLFNILKELSDSDGYVFELYHKADFNSFFDLSGNSNLIKKKTPNLPAWTQTVFPLFLNKNKPDLVWIPLQNLPRFGVSNLRSVVTIHDLAFKFYPEKFPQKDVVKLNSNTDYAVKKASHLIAVSQSTKKDLVDIYNISDNKITVIHHGFNEEEWMININKKKITDVLLKYNVSDDYILFVGAIQPRKNIKVLIEAFEIIKEKKKNLKLVIAGAPAWLYEDTYNRIRLSKYNKDIICTGAIDFDTLKVFYRGASVFVLPAIKEGFGIPLLEAYASGIPTIIANSGSLPEVSNGASLMFNPTNPLELSKAICKILNDVKLKERLIDKGFQRLKCFSWRNSAKNTIEVFNKVLTEIN